MILKVNNSISRYGLFLSVLLGVSGCGVYSFTGASIDYSQVKTISIQTFYDDSGEGPPNLSQTFTEKLKDYFQQNTSLSIVGNDGDLQLEGSITGYSLDPVAATSAGNVDVVDAAGLMRLTITVRCIYINTQDDTFDFEKNFSFYDQYDPSTSSLNAEQDQLIETITDKIINDIFNASVANW